MISTIDNELTFFPPLALTASKVICATRFCRDFSTWAKAGSIGVREVIDSPSCWFWRCNWGCCSSGSVVAVVSIAVVASVTEVVEKDKGDGDMWLKDRCFCCPPSFGDEDTSGAWLYWPGGALSLSSSSRWGKANPESPSPSEVDKKERENNNLQSKKKKCRVCDDQFVLVEIKLH